MDNAKQVAVSSRISILLELRSYTWFEEWWQELSPEDRTDLANTIEEIVEDRALTWARHTKGQLPEQQESVADG